jgi:uncharacterized damage-inducible protein DinB
MNHLSRLVAHLGWADNLVLESLRPDADAGALELFGHILGAEAVWLSRVKGEKPDVPVWPSIGLDECAALAERTREEIAAFVARLTPADLARPVSYVNSAGRQFTSTVEDILLHICLHGAYHRGQIARALRQAGQKPNPTDYIAYIRGAPAATRHDRTAPENR